MNDPFDLQRFVQAQTGTYERALAEIKSGEKRSHWMWFVFPQLKGLGRSAMAERYAIKSVAEASAYLLHPILGPRLTECAEAVLAIEGRSAHDVFGSPDDAKLKSCATLFAYVSSTGSVFHRLLERYFAGHADAKTLDLLASVRVATMSDVPALQELISSSVRGLSGGYYNTAQIDAALTKVFGVDSQLIADGTYYVIDGPLGPVAAGGWSARRTLYGGDQLKGAIDPLLDPLTAPARIRAFFVHPDFARRGLATRLYSACAHAAHAAGFRQFELMATLPGEPLYAALGFTVVEQVTLQLAADVDLTLARMVRHIDAG